MTKYMTIPESMELFVNLKLGVISVFI